jgi:hypothetical protein
VTTICDGRILMRRGEVLTVNEAETLRKAKEYREKILKSLEK